MTLEEAETSADALLEQLDAFKQTLSVSFADIRDKCVEKYGPPEVSQNLGEIQARMEAATTAGKGRLVIDASGTGSGSRPGTGQSSSRPASRQTAPPLPRTVLYQDGKLLPRGSKKAVAAEEEEEQEDDKVLSPAPPSRPSPLKRAPPRRGTPPPSLSPKGKVSLPKEAPKEKPNFKSGLLDFALEGEDHSKEKRLTSASPVEDAQGSGNQQENLKIDIAAALASDLAEVKANSPVGRSSGGVKTPLYSLPARENLITPRTAERRGAPTPKEMQGGLTWRPKSRGGGEGATPSRPASRPSSSMEGPPATTSGLTSRVSSSIGFHVKSDASVSGVMSGTDKANQAMAEMKKASAMVTKAEGLASLFSLGTRPQSAAEQQRAKAKARRGMLKK